MLGIEPWSSGRATSALNRWAISPAPYTIFFFLVYKKIKVLDTLALICTKLHIIEEPATRCPVSSQGRHKPLSPSESPGFGLESITTLVSVWRDGRIDWPQMFVTWREAPLSLHSKTTEGSLKLWLNSRQPVLRQLAYHNSVDKQ